jgi:DNA-directed RNA polymerase sigma subunit (sigma70/sigma32)
VAEDDEEFAALLRESLPPPRLSLFTPREQVILRRLLDDAQSYAAIGKELGVSGERVRQILRKASARLGGFAWIDAALMRVREGD